MAPFLAPVIRAIVRTALVLPLAWLVCFATPAQAAQWDAATLTVPALFISLLVLLCCWSAVLLSEGASAAYLVCATRVALSKARSASAAGVRRRNVAA